MNYQLPLFFIDLASWVTLSSMFWIVVSNTDESRKGKRGKDGVVFILSSLCAGFLSMLMHGLPEGGFAWYCFGVVFLTVMIHAAILSPQLKMKIRQSVNTFFTVVVTYFEKLKGGEVYGNSSQ